MKELTAMKVVRTSFHGALDNGCNEHSQKHRIDLDQPRGSFPMYTCLECGKEGWLGNTKTRKLAQQARRSAARKH